MATRRLMLAGFAVALDTPADTFFPVRVVQGYPVVAASGEIDICTAPALAEALEAAAGISERAILDLSAVSFLDSSGLAAILGGHAHDHPPPRARSLVLVGATAMVHQVLIITGVSSQFPMCASVDEAIAELR
jgi:anti-sigma B factor antagonist